MEKITKKETEIKNIVFKVLVYTFLALFGLFVLIPFYWMILTSIKSIDQIRNEIPPSLLIGFKQIKFWENYTDAWGAATYGKYMLNTVAVSAISTTGTIFTTIFASFAFSRLNFKGRDILFLVLISTMMIPGEMFVITNYSTVIKLGWFSLLEQTYPQALLALTMPFMTSVFYIFFLRQAFRQIPDTLYLAAKVDGTSDWKYLWRIMVPIASPTIITITILNAMGTWSAYIWPTMVTMKDEYKLVTNGLRSAYSDFGGMVLYNQQMAAALIVTAPLLITFLFLRKYIMRGVSRAGIKG